MLSITYLQLEYFDQENLMTALCFSLLQNVYSEGISLPGVSLCSDYPQAPCFESISFYDSFRGRGAGFRNSS